jgi:hypothetical protein
MNKNIFKIFREPKKVSPPQLGLNWALSLPEDNSTYNVFDSHSALKFQEEFSKINNFAGYSSSHMSMLSVLALFSSDLPRSYLEIGVNEGLSIYTLLSGIKFQRLLNFIPVESKPILEELVLADCWGNEYGGTGRSDHRHIEDLLSSAGNIKQTTFLNGDSKITLPNFLKDRPIENNCFDFIYVDGDHSYTGAKTDIENILPYVGKVLFFDDMYHPAHYENDNLLELHKHFVNKLKNEFYIFINKHGYGFSAYIRKENFDLVTKNM